MSLAQILHVLSGKLFPEFGPFAKASARTRRAVGLSAKGTARANTSAGSLKNKNGSRSSRTEPAEKLYLRELVSGDYENWRQAYTMMAPSQNHFDEGPWKESELTPAKFREHLRKLKKYREADETYSFGVFREDDGVLVGIVNFMGVSRGVFQNAYLGYRIFNPYWRRGYATQAVTLAIQVAFKELKLHRIEAGISPDNEASLKLAQAVGLRCEGLSRRRLHIQGQWEDLLLFAATSEDFGIKYGASKFTK